MEAKNRVASSGVPSSLLAMLLIAFAAITVYIFAARVFPAPPPITSSGAQIDRQYNLTLFVTGAIFILAQLGLAYAVFRFRDRGQRAVFTCGSNLLEFLWTAAAILLFVGLGLLGRKTWAEARFSSAASNAIQVEVTESQFVFNFRYPGRDGKFGKLNPRLISPSTGNPLGIDPSDPAGKDDIVTPVLTVPLNHQIELLIRSQDVIHNFFVRELRLQEDAVPGMVVPLHFTPDKIGRYEIVCTQLCGLGHNRMRGFLNVVSESDYRNFLMQQEQAAAQ